MTNQLTPWFPPGVVPVRHGVYETRWVAKSRRPNFPQYQHWNGTFWGGWGMDVPMAIANMHGASSRQESEWRGFTSEQK